MVDLTQILKLIVNNHRLVKWKIFVTENSSILRKFLTKSSDLLKNL